MNMDTQNSSNNKEYFISFSEWVHIQNIKKTKKIKEIDSLLAIQNSEEHNIFNLIFNKLIRINIFDLSRISYLVILFLSPYIDPHLKEILNYDEDIPTVIINRIYNTELHDYLPPLDKTIGTIIALVLNQLISIELFLNIQIFILYLNLYYHYKSPSSKTTKNLHIFKISQLVATITKKIPKFCLSLLIMKITNKLGKIQANYFDDNILIGLEKEYINTKINEIVNTSSKNNELLDDFIISIMKLCDTSNADKNVGFNVDADNGIDVGASSDNFTLIWNASKNHIINMARNGIKLLKIGLDILIIHLVKEQPELQSNASCICNSIMNFLEMEIIQLDEKLNI